MEPGGQTATASVTTSQAEEVSQGGATLLGSFSGATGQVRASGFVWGESSSDLPHDIQLGGYASGVTSGGLEYTLDGLVGGKTYYYKAYVQVWDDATSTAVPVYGGLQSFTTPTTSANVPTGWLELPTPTSGSDYYTGSFSANGERNYSYLYQKSRYTSLWTAYPLTASHISGSASNKTWAYNPDSNIPEDIQINVKSNSYETNYGDETFSRGHLLPAADRKCNSVLRAQTYYLTNQTPQNQNGFNSPMWSNLEEAVRSLTSSTDTVYVVTGAAFRKVGGSETISELHAAKDGIYPETLYIPNYFWKVLLKVKRSGKSITEASAIGIWMEHSNNSSYSQTAWKSHVYSVNKIEEWTGFDFFTNLPGTESSGIEATAEANTNWAAFEDF